MSKINSYDIDGVIFLDGGLRGLRPFEDDVIITGRSFEEENDTIQMLQSKGIFNKVFFNQLPFHAKTRSTSAVHKAMKIKELINNGVEIGIHFEDDPLQYEIIKNECGHLIRVVQIGTYGLVELENVRRTHEENV